MISQVVSVDIIKYLQDKKGMDIKDIANAMGTTPTHIKTVLKNKTILTPDNINTYLKFADMHFWEFMFTAIPLSHLSERVKNRVLLCKNISDHMKKRGENS